MNRPLRSLILIASIVTAICLFAAGPRVRSLLLNTAYLTIGVELLAWPIILVLAVLITRTDLIGRRCLRLLLFSLLFIPLYLQLCGWDAAFGRLGWYSVSYGTVAQPLLSSWQAAIWIHAAYAVPWGVLIVGAALAAADSDLEDVARLDGSTRQVLQGVVLPSLAGVLFATAVWIAAFTAGEMTVTNIYLVRTFTEEFYGALAGSSDYEGAAMGTWPMLLVAGWLVAVTGATVRFPERRTEHSPRVWRLGGYRFLATASAWAIGILLTLFPVLNLLQRCGATVVVRDGEPIRGWSAAKVGRVLADVPFRFQEEFATTLSLSLLTALSAVAITVPIAWRMRRSPVAIRIAWIIAAAGLAMPAPLIGLAVIRMFNQPSSPLMLWLYDRTLAPPLAALLVRAIPPLLLLFTWWFATLPLETFEAAELDGAGPWRRWWNVGLPASRGVIAAGAIIAAVIASGDLSASLLTLPPGTSTVASRMFGLVHSGVEEQVAGIGIIAWVLYFILAIVAMKLFASQRESRRAEGAS